MGRYLVRLTDAQGPVFFEWSTIVDAPVSPGFSTEDELRAWLDATGQPSDEERFERLRHKGTSSYIASSAEDTVGWNRAGPGATCLSIPKLVAQLRPTPQHPEGEPR